MKCNGNFHLLIVFLAIFTVNSELIGLIELFRHGARTPSNISSVTSKLLYGTEKMQLTNNGWRQHFILGKALRKKYNDLFTDSLEVNVLASPKQRCIFSATAQIHGMFGTRLINYENLNPNLSIKEDDLPPGFQLSPEDGVKIKIVDPLNNYYYYPENCEIKTEKELIKFYEYFPKSEKKKENRKDLIKALRKSDKIDDRNAKKNRVSENKTILLEILSKHTKLASKMHSIFDFSEEELTKSIDNIIASLKKAFSKTIKNEEWSYLSFSQAEKYNSETLGKLSKFIVPLRYHFKSEFSKELNFDSEVEKTVRKSNINNFYSDKIKNDKDNKNQIYHFSALMDDMIDKLDKATNKKKQLSLYSGHDSTIVSFLVNLLDNEKIKPRLIKSVDNEEENQFFIPPFATSMIFELHEKDGKKSIKVFYNNKELKNDWISTITYTEDGIDFEQFKKAFSKCREKGEWKCKSD